MPRTSAAIAMKMSASQSSPPAAWTTDSVNWRPIPVWPITPTTIPAVAHAREIGSASTAPVRSPSRMVRHPTRVRFRAIPVTTTARLPTAPTSGGE